MFIDVARMEEKLQIDLDITLPAVPCELSSYDAQDVMGSHDEVDGLENLFKGRLTSKGGVADRAFNQNLWERQVFVGRRSRARQRVPRTRHSREVSRRAISLANDK